MIKPVPLPPFQHLSYRTINKIAVRIDTTFYSLLFVGQIKSCSKALYCSRRQRLGFTRGHVKHSK